MKIIDATEPNRYRWNVFVIECGHHAQEPEEHIKPQIERAGGIYCGAVAVPAWNVWGQRMGNRYVVVYQAAEAIEAAVWT